MSEKRDGGPAFPQMQCCDEEGRLSPVVIGGMSLRDWFAGNAREEDIQAHMNYFAEGCSFTRTREEARYHYADAMLKAREVGDD